MKIALSLILIFSLGCASVGDTKSYGNSSAVLKGGDIITETTTTTWPDGRVEVTVVETGVTRVEEAVGGEGSDKLYEAVLSIVSMFLSVGSIVVQVLK